MLESSLIQNSVVTRVVYWVIGSFIALTHLLLSFVSDSDSFIRADRSPQRLKAITRLIDSSQTFDSFIHQLSAQGNVGDYGIHAALYWFAGPPGVIAFQIVLAVASTLCVISISYHAFNSRAIAIASGLIYSLLPQSLAFPHQLTSEALANPLVIFGTASFLRALGPRNRTLPWILAGASFGFAALIRPALILLPLSAALLLICIDRKRMRSSQLGIFIACGVAPFLLWGLFMLSQTGQFGPGQSNQDLGINLSQSTAKVLLAEGLAKADGRPPEWLQRRLTLPEYLHFVAKYPGGFTNLYIANTFVMLADSGIGRLYVDVLGIGAEARLQLMNPLTGWRAQLTNHGLLAMLEAGWRVAPGTILVGVVGALGFALINVGVLIAYLVLLHRDSALRNALTPLTQRWCLAFMLIIPIYVLTTSQVTAYAPSRLRSQGEFAWAILACIGWAVVFRQRHVVRSSAQVPRQESATN